MHGTINIKFALIIHYSSLFTEVLAQQPEDQSHSQQQYTRNNKHTHTNKTAHKNNKPKDKNSVHLTNIPDLFYNIVTIIPYIHNHHN